MAKPDFWEDVRKAGEVSREYRRLEDFIERWEHLKNEIEDAELLLQLAIEENDEESIVELIKTLKSLQQEAEKMRIETLLDGPNDNKKAIVAINAGAGGTEAQDWVEMLLRMYLRWAERKGYKTRILDILPGDEAGIKNVTFSVDGEYAYGYLKAETGIHRLVRISPFDASGRRHTSFAAVYVYPDADEEIVIDIKDKDLRIDTYRASGAGGQHVNKTSSAVRITHIPTGIVVQCQNEKSQHRNKEIAMKVLRARLYQLELDKKAEEMKAIHESQQEIAWGSQIRSYILQPYRLVKDHRTNLEDGKVDAVLDGEIDHFIEAYLWHEKKNDTKKEVVAVS